MNPFFLTAALADLAAAVVHGYVGHRLVLARLTGDRLFSTPLGDADMSRRLLVTTWHLPTAAFASSALMMLLWAFRAGIPQSGPLFVSAMHASFLVVGVAVGGRRIAALPRHPIPVAFATLMTTVALMGWLGSL